MPLRAPPVSTLALLAVSLFATSASADEATGYHLRAGIVCPEPGKAVAAAHALYARDYAELHRLQCYAIGSVPVLPLGTSRYETRVKVRVGAQWLDLYTVPALITRD